MKTILTAAVSLIATSAQAVPLSDIRAINREVNRTITYRSDGPVDRWTVGGQYGDCEDYALTKRERLMALGARTQDARLVLGYDWRGRRHAVLFARDDDGRWWVLDNQDSRVRSPDATGMDYDDFGPWGDPRNEGEGR